MGINTIREQKVEIIRSISLRTDDPLFAPVCLRLKDGLLYVVNEAGNKVHVLDADFRTVNVLGGYGKEPGEFWYPSSLCFDDEENIYIADKWNHRVQVFDKNFIFKGQIGTYGIGRGEFNEPASVAWANGVLYVAERSNGRLQGFTQMQEAVYYYQNHAPLAQFYEGMSFKHSKHYQRWLSNVNRFYSMHDQFKECGFKLGVIEYPEELALTISGDVIVVDKVNAIAVKFSPHLAFKQHLTLNVSHFDDIPSECCQIHCVATDDNGAVWFGSDLSGSVVRMDGEGMNVLRIPQARITSLAVSEPYLYIGDFWNGTILKVVCQEI